MQNIVYLLQLSTGIRGENFIMFPELASMDTESLQDLKKLNDKTIVTLESDIQLLKWQLKQFGPSAEYGALSKG